MSLENKTVRLFAVNDAGVVCSLEATLGELVSGCNSKRCPMGMFSCPVSRSIRCEDVTVETWAGVFRVKEVEDGQESNQR